MRTGTYFIFLTAILIPLLGLLLYLHNTSSWFFALEFLLLLFLMVLAVIALATIGFATSFPNYLLLAFFTLAMLDSLLFYFLYGRILLFAVLIITGAIGVVMTLGLFDRATGTRTAPAPPEPLPRQLQPGLAKAAPKARKKAVRKTGRSARRKKARASKKEDKGR